MPAPCPAPSRYSANGHFPPQHNSVSVPARDGAVILSAGCCPRLTFIYEPIGGTPHKTPFFCLEKWKKLKEEEKRQVEGSEVGAARVEYSACWGWEKLGASCTADWPLVVLVGLGALDPSSTRFNQNWVSMVR